MKYFYDTHKIRYTLVSKNDDMPINWLFIPGGPGCDSSYFLSLTKLLTLPGNIWLVDFPGNGSNVIQKQNFDDWLSIFLPMLRDFNNPIIVGHSFGGMLPLLFQECETLLKGLIILNSSPCLWLDEAAQYAKEHGLPDLSFEMKEFTENPNQETFEKALDACMPYYFPKHSLEIGRQLLKNIPISFEPAVWWQRKAIEIAYNAKWVPQVIPTLIIGSAFDAITPFTLYQKDERFDRDNIKKIFIEDAGHLPWVEKPDEVKAVFQAFLTWLESFNLVQAT